MEEKIYASELAGHADEFTAWRLLKEMSETLSEDGLRPVNPYCIEIRDDGHFVLTSTDAKEHPDFNAPENTGQQPTEAEVVWSLAATVFYIVMGCQVMNGKGSKGQQEHSKLPYMRSEWPAFSELVQQCLHYDPERRPSLHEIYEKATLQHQHNLDEIKKGPKLKTTENSSPNETNEPEISFWPETMKRIFTLLIIITITIGYTFAQAKTDPELQRLTQTVASLRQSDKSVWDEALKAFRQDSLWTTMDEIVRDDNEFWLVGDQQFKLNAILNQCSGHDKKMVRGDFLNGNDPHYNYSLTERGVKRLSSVSYEMSYREGRQTFVIMPYIAIPEKIEVKAYLNNTRVGETTISDGNIVLNINANVKKSDTLRLVITNLGNEDMPVVIINHNTRKNP